MSVATEAAKVTALGIVRALARGDAELFDQAAAGVDDNVRGMLLVWLAECLAGQYVVFTAADREGFDLERLRVVRTALARFPHARARIGVRAALEPLVRARS